jgi:ABC-type antimicrobial peptide transport system permease subunit
LIKQFLGESGVVVLIAGTIAFLLVLLVFPRFGAIINPSFEQRLTFYFANGWFWLGVLGFFLLTTLLAGSYPAFYLSSFMPVKVLKGIVKTKKSWISPRKVLIVVQFTIACALIMATLVIQRQIKYVQSRDSGFNKDHLIFTWLEGDIDKNYELIKRDLINSGTAVSVTKTMSTMSSSAYNRIWGVNWQGKDPNERLTFDLFFVDTDWAKTVGVNIIEGRDIDIYTYPTDSTAMILNESAVKIMNFEHPIGEIVSYNGRDWHIVGVVKDFILRLPTELIQPMIIGGPAGWFRVIHIKLNGNNYMADNLAQVEKVFKEYNPAYPFEYRFVDEDYIMNKLMMEQTISKVITWVANFAIFITCLGLFALVAYMVEIRKKEIAIRKVMGASPPNIMFLLTKEFLTLTLISFVIASPIAWFAMNQWLSSYAYRTDIPWWLFVIVGCMSLCIVLLTVGFQVVNAAMENPVKAIKSE